MMHQLSLDRRIGDFRIQDAYVGLDTMMLISKASLVFYT